MYRFRRPPRRRDWLGLGEASRFLGVSEATLRRWSDAGEISAFTTPGGHRRYRRTMLERLVPGDRTARPSVGRAGLTSGRLARAYRREARSAADTMPWLLDLTEPQREWFRSHGRRLAHSLLGYLDADDTERAAAGLADATAEAAEYGRFTSGLGISLSQAVEGFLQFRRPFLHELGLVASRRGLDAMTTTNLLETTDRAMDSLLLATMTAHSVARIRPTHRDTVDIER